MHARDIFSLFFARSQVPLQHLDFNPATLQDVANSDEEGILQRATSPQPQTRVSKGQVHSAGASGPELEYRAEYGPVSLAGGGQVRSLRTPDSLRVEDSTLSSRVLHRAAVTCSHLFRAHKTTLDDMGTLLQRHRGGRPTEARPVAASAGPSGSSAQRRCHSDRHQEGAQRGKRGPGAQCI